MSVVSRLDLAKNCSLSHTADFHHGLLSLLLVLAGIATAASAQCPDGTVVSSDNMVKNGDFSLGDRDFESSYTFVAEHRELPAGHYGVVSDSQAIHRGFAACKSDHTGYGGKMFAVNGTAADGTVVWQQTFDVEPSSVYMFSTWVAHVTLPDLNPARLQFAINGVELDQPFDASGEPCAWLQFYSVWDSGESSQATISIVNKNLELHGNDFALDDIRFFACDGKNLDDRLAEGIEVGESIPLRNVFFDTDSASIRSTSHTELDRLAQHLRDHPSIEIAVDGHTDNSGGEQHNQQLSSARASAICGYLQSRKISTARCHPKGFGASRPLASNETYEGRQKNRRVEFRVIEDRS